MPRCLVSLGSNLGDTHAALDAAVHGLRQLAEPDSLRLSKRHDTPPIGGPEHQNGFLNAAACFETSADAASLLRGLQQIELAHDRRRGVRWAPRTLDIDLLLFDESVVTTPTLRVPHPRMTFRPFVLAPACEIAADWRHPECDRTLSELQHQLRGGRDAVRLVGNAPGVREWIEAADPCLAIEAGEDSQRLTIDARGSAEVLVPGGPRLVLADCPREHWRDEVVAALECVWPSSD